MKFFNLLFLTIILAITSGNLFAARRFSSGELILGSGSPAVHKLTSDQGTAAPPFMQYDSVTGKWQFSNDGAVVKNLGSGSGSGSGGVNLLLNNSFEDGLGNWTNSGGTFTQEDYTNAREGNTKFARFISTVAGQYVESDAITISDDIGPGCMADLKYSQGDNAFEYKVLKSPYADPADVVSVGTISDLTEFDKAPTIIFPCSPGELFKIRVVSTGAGTIDVDDFYNGSNKGFIDIDSVNNFSARIANNGTASITSSSASFIQSVSRTSPGLVVVNFVPGFFTVIPKVGATIDVIGASDIAGVTSIAVDSVTIYTKDNAGTLGDNNFNIHVAKQGVDAVKESQPAFSPEQASFNIDVNVGGANLASSVSSSYVPFQSATVDMVINPGSSSAEIPCSSTNPSTGLTCSSGEEQLGVAFVPPVAGDYRVCMYGTINVTQGMFLYTQWIETANNSQTIISDGQSRQGLRAESIGGGVDTPITNCATFKFNDVSKKTLRFAYESSAATGLFMADRSSGQRDARITVELVGHNVSRPILTGDQIIAEGEDKTVFFGAHVLGLCNTDPCNIQSKIGSNIVSIGRSAVGTYPVTLSYPLADVPICIAEENPNANIAYKCLINPGTTNSSITVRCTSGSSDFDEGFKLICVGKKP